MKHEKILVFLDIDGTLLDDHYRPTCNHLPRLLTKMRSVGFKFLLNSNRAKEDMAPLAAQFQINGPLVVENGAYLWWPESDRKEWLLPDHAMVAQDMALLWSVVKDAFPSARLLKADTVHFNQAETESTLFLFNQYRQVTASIHARKNGQRDRPLSTQLLEKLQAWCELKGRRYQALMNPAFCNGVVCSTATSKSAGIAYLKREVFPGAPVVMIGDEEQDAAVQPLVDLFCAVGNASDATKQAAQLVATKSYTEGVYEILTKLPQLLKG